jgi:hypothetical protein
MRIIWTCVVFLLVGSAIDAARADPYPWCAIYNVGDAAYSCYFLTFEQCQKSISGIGGICRPNMFYDGHPGSSASATPRPAR